jgi:hypothetical protein
MVDPTDVPLASPPTWLLEGIQPRHAPKTTREPSRTTALIDQVRAGRDRIPEGVRHNYMIWRAGKLRHEGAGSEEILSELVALNEANCDPPLIEDELSQIADWVSRQPSFGEEYDRLRQTWAFPSGLDTRSISEWKVKQALLRIAWNCQSSDIAPGIRRLALEAKVSDKTAQSIVTSLRRRRELVPSPRSWTVGRARSYRLRRQRKLKSL